MDGPFETLPGGHRLLRLAECGSTSDVARDGFAAGKLLPGDAVAADVQSAGRGRRGRTWVTVPGRSLAVSILLPPPAEGPLVRLVPRFAVAAARALEAHGAPTISIKWPNDLMRGERKLGGLLLETAHGPAGTTCLVLGCGFNLALAPGDLPEELADHAGAADIACDPAARRALVSSLLAELDAALNEPGSPADAARGEEYRRRAWLTGRAVTVAAGGRELSGRVLDTSADGDLLLAPGGWLRGETLTLVRVESREPRPPLRDTGADAGIEAPRPRL